MGFQIPSREFQLEFFRYALIVSYLLTGALLSVILVNVTSNKEKWIANIGLDVVLISVFFIYCRNVHKQSVRFHKHMFV